MLSERLDRLIYDIIDESLPSIEQTSTRVMNQHISEFIMRSNSNGMISGIDIIQRVIEIIDDSIEIKVINGSGSIVEKDDIIAIFRGKTSTLLQSNTLIINITEQLSQITSQVYFIRSNLQDPNIAIYAHGSFTPLFQPFEHYVIEQAGGILLDQAYSHFERVSMEYVPMNMPLEMFIQILRSSIDHQVFIAVEVNTYEEYNAALRAECDMIVLCDFSLDTLTSCFDVDAPEYIRIIQGNYNIHELSVINQLHPDGILMDSLHNIKSPFHVAIEQTR